MLTRKLGRRAALLSAAHVVVRLEEYAFDYLLYPYMLYVGGDAVASLLMPASGGSDVGYWTGFALLCLASLLLNILYLRLYDRSRRDWFGFEYLRTIPPPSVINRRPWIGFGLRVASFCYLSVWHSPLFATLWSRSRDRVFSMSKNDWVLFSVAVFTANAGWAVVVTSVVSLGRLIGASVAS